MLATFVLTLVLAQASPRGVVVAGVVQDQTGAILPGAQVTISVAGSPGPTQSAITDRSGAFRIERVPPGEYDIKTKFPGFAPKTTHIRVGPRSPSPLTIVLAIEGLQQEVSVSGGGTATSTAVNANLNAITVDANQLDDLPVLDQDVVTAMSRFLDSSAIGTNGATVIVNGIEVNTLSLSASAIQQIKINQDPYSSEFMRPGRGRIEIITKPGGQSTPVRSTSGSAIRPSRRRTRSPRSSRRSSGGSSKGRSAARSATVRRRASCCPASTTCRTTSRSCTRRR